MTRNNQKVVELEARITKLTTEVDDLTKKMSDIKGIPSEIDNYYKKIFDDSDEPGIKKRIEQVLGEATRVNELITEFNFFWIGDNQTMSFEKCKQDIQSTQQEASKLNTTIADQKETLSASMTEIEGIKKDLNAFRDSVVAGSLFQAYGERTQHNDNASRKYSRGSIGCLLLSAVVMAIVLMSKDVGHFLPISISIILLTASFVCSSKSKIYHKLAEEYAHKTTLLQSFIGYRSEYKEQLTPEEYQAFFSKIIAAISVNASDKCDKLLHFKWPWEKAIAALSK